MNAVGSAHELIAFWLPPLSGPARATGNAHHSLSILDGGNQRIVGTVKNTGVPNAPVFRRVRLHDQRSGRVISETWSDATTGDYAFNNLALGTYFVTSFDHTNQYNGVIASDLVPEAGP